MDYFKTQDIPCGKALTSKQFVKLFNHISDDYCADIQFNGDITIADRDDEYQVAVLWYDSQYWLFEYQRAYDWKELYLMVRLASNMPELRNGKNNG